MSHSTPPMWFDGLEQDPNYAVKANPSCPTKIFANHVGFLPDSHKSCTIINPPSREFTVRKNVVNKRGGGHGIDRVNSTAQPTGENQTHYRYYRYAYSLELIAMAVFLRRAAVILDEPAYAAIAQRQIDWVLGCNPFDRSSVEGVGYGQWEHVKTGEFFPPTPQIPGAVHCGDNSEYDLPPTGLLLGALAMLSVVD